MTDRENANWAAACEMVGARLTYVRKIAVALNAKDAEIERLQRIIDSRPAINAGLPESYITWSHSIYEMEAARAFGLSDR